MSDKDLIIFDIDGTITDSVAMDFRCFGDALELIFPFHSTDIPWNTFNNMTDSSLIRDIVQLKLNRNPTAEEIGQFQIVFYEKLEQHVTEMIPVLGAQPMIAALRKADNCEVAFATGCWRTSAKVKLSRANIVLDDFAHATADDHSIRTKIVAKAIARIFEISNLKKFNSVTYVGDGLWDLRSANELGIDFIGVDIHGSDVLLAGGATKVLRNFEGIYTVADLLNHSQ